MTRHPMLVALAALAMTSCLSKPTAQTPGADAKADSFGDAAGGDAGIDAVRQPEARQDGLADAVGSDKTTKDVGDGDLVPPDVAQTEIGTDTPVGPDATDALDLADEVCTPDCTGKQCGSDGCGGWCGDCALMEACWSGSCMPKESVVKWSSSVGASCRSGVTIGPDGTVYYGNGEGYLGALQPASGISKWKVMATNGNWTPSVHPDGLIFTTLGDGNIHVLGEDGKFLVTKPMNAAGKTTEFAISSAGNIYAGLDDQQSMTGKQGGLVSYKLDGSFRWTVPTDSFVWGAPCLTGDGAAFFGTHSGELLAVDADGSVRWSKSVAGKIAASCAVGAGGAVIYFAVTGNDAGTGSLAAFKAADGDKQWSLPVGGTSTSPIVGPGGTVYVSANTSEAGGGRLYSVSPAGKLNWDLATQLPNANAMTISLDSDGRVYCADYENLASPSRLYAVAPDGQVEWVFYSPLPLFGGARIASDGTILAGTMASQGGGNYVLAIHGPATGPGKSPWPTRGHDAMLTGQYTDELGTPPK